MIASLCVLIVYIVRTSVVFVAQYWHRVMMLLIEELWLKMHKLFML